MEATFEIHRCLDIVLDNLESHTNWTYRRATSSRNYFLGSLANEALLHSLEPADIFKVIPHRDSAAVIWTCVVSEMVQELEDVIGEYDT